MQPAKYQLYFFSDVNLAVLWIELLASLDSGPIIPISPLYNTNTLYRKVGCRNFEHVYQLQDIVFEYH